MQKTLLETFVGLKLTDRQKKMFEEVQVEFLRVYKHNRQIQVGLVSNHLISYREIKLLKYQLELVLGSTGFDVEIKERYVLSEQYTPAIVWQEYKQSVLERLKDHKMIDFNILYHGQITMEGNTLTIVCEDDRMYRARQQQLIQRLEQMFQDLVDMQIHVEMEYIPAKPVEYTEVQDDPGAGAGRRRGTVGGDAGSGVRSRPEEGGEACGCCGSRRNCIRWQGVTAYCSKAVLRQGGRQEVRTKGEHLFRKMGWFPQKRQKGRLWCH